MDTSYLTTQVTTIIGQLHSIFDDIGVPQNERDARETELFSALSEALNNQLRLVNAEKTSLTEEAQNIIKTIKQMEASLDDEKYHDYDLGTDGLQIAFPLNDCLRDLKEKYNTVSRLHRERFEQVKKLVQALESYSSHLEASFVKIHLPPTSATSCAPNFDLSPSYVATLDEEFTRVYEEYNKRAKLIQTMAEEVVRLWSDLGIPQAQTDTSIVQHYRDSPEQLGLHQSDIDRLRNRRDKLLEEKKGREQRLKETRSAIEALWDRLGIQESERKIFLAANRGCGLRTINEFEDELSRLNELKRQNLHLFVEDARVRLQELWDSLYFSEEEMLDFTPAFSDVYSDALLSAHEAEIERLIVLKAQRAPVLAAIERHRSLINDRDSLVASANDASRLMLKPAKGEKRDPGKLLREEKMRKRIAKELPKVAAELTKTLQSYEDEFGRPFLVHGERYLDELEVAETTAPPARSKTPNGLPNRAKTPSNNHAPVKSAPASSARTVPLARPGSVMGGPTLPKAVNRTPTRYQAALRQPGPSTVTSVTNPSTSSPSKLPTRIPLGSLQHGGHNNSTERHHLPPNQHNPPTDFSQTVRTMGPPRAPPPRMRDLFEAMEQQQQSQTQSVHSSAFSSRPASVISSSESSASSKFVRPISPEDVYDDRERMSYMSTSMVNRDRPYQPNFHSSSQRQPHHALIPRQTSNTSSNMTTGTTVSGSENWETYSDISELEPERDGREVCYAKVQAASGKRMGPAHAFAYGPASMKIGMAPPAAKMRLQDRIEEGDENRQSLMRVEGSDAAWSTEQEETY